MQPSRRHSPVDAFFRRQNVFAGCGYRQFRNALHSDYQPVWISICPIVGHGVDNNRIIRRHRGRSVFMCRSDAQGIVSPSWSHYMSHSICGCQAVVAAGANHQFRDILQCDGCSVSINIQLFLRAIKDDGVSDADFLLIHYTGSFSSLIVSYGNESKTSPPAL